MEPLSVPEYLSCNIDHTFQALAPAQVLGRGVSMLKRIAIAAVAALGISVSAQAADQPVKGPVYKAAPAYNWSGWYWGGQIGGIWGDVDQDNISAGNFTSYNMSGVIGGLHIGRNWQFGNPWLFGIEADVNLTSLKGDDGGFGGLVDELKGRAE
jgi:opacity protein-like surface antigen